LAGESALPVDGILIDRGGSIRWIADNSKKGISRSGYGAVTIHATTDFSLAHYGKSEGEITQLLLHEAQAWFGESQIVATFLQRFKFSEPQRFYPEPCLWLADLGLGFAGDAFGTRGIEGAALSGLALAEQIGLDLAVD